METGINPARDALTRAVNNAIVKGAPIYTNIPANAQGDKAMQIIETLKPGQIWRVYSDKDYGDIIRWKVTLVKGKTGIVTNCATLQEKVIYGQDALNSFTLDCELMESESNVAPLTQEQKNESAIALINIECESHLEYETKHYDAGNNYAFMVAESWLDQKSIDLVKWCKETRIDMRGIEPDILADIALDCFTMESGSILVNSVSDGHILDSFAVSELELDLSHLDIDSETWEQVKGECYCYIDDNSGLAYITTDSVWYAVLTPQAMQDGIARHD